MTVWRQEEEEKVEVREHGYLTLLQLRSPTHTFRQDLSDFRAQGKCTLFLSAADRRHAERRLWCVLQSEALWLLITTNNNKYSNIFRYFTSTFLTL